MGLVGIDLARVLGVENMVAALRSEGWTGEDLARYVRARRQHDFSSLDAFAGGELSKIEDPELRGVMEELTAIKMAMEDTGAKIAQRAVPQCPHGFRMSACQDCAREGAA